MKSTRRLSWREWMLFGFPVAVAATLIFLSIDSRLNPLHHSREKRRRWSCQVNLKEIGLAYKAYSQDHDGKFPQVVSRGFSKWPGRAYTTRLGWADALQFHLHSYSVFWCPSDEKLIVLSKISWSKDMIDAKGFLCYYLNSNLARQNIQKLSSPQSIILVGEGNDGNDISDATYSKSSFPPEWIADQNSPAWRHLGGANYLMADGSVHWLRPNEVTTFGGRKDAFALK